MLIKNEFGKYEYLIQGHKRIKDVLNCLVKECHGILKNPEWMEDTNPKWWYYPDAETNIIKRVSDIDDEVEFKVIKAQYTVLYHNGEGGYISNLYERPIDEFRVWAWKALYTDVIDINFYDVLDAIPVDYPGLSSGIIDLKPDEPHKKGVDDLKSWLDEYKKDKERLSIYEPIIMNSSSSGCICICNGLNGPTKVHKDSLNHIMDIITYIETHFKDAKAYISYVSNHSDVYYYVINFVIWEE